MTGAISKQRPQEQSSGPLAFLAHVFPAVWPHARRKPREHQPMNPGDSVQVDTMEVKPTAGMVDEPFTARDVCSKWDVVSVYSRATATNATRFLNELIARTPFEVRGIQIAGGSEVKAESEDACRERGILLFALPPRSLKLNGCVERASREYDEDCHQFNLTEHTVLGVRRLFHEAERVDNFERPHQRLDNLTPNEFLQKIGFAA